MPPKKPSRHPSPRRTRRSPQKRSYSFLRYASGIAVAIALIATGYLIGTQAKKQDRKPTEPLNQKHAPASKSPINTIFLAEAPKNKTIQPAPKKKPSAMDILRYGFEEDARGDAAPDVSWYVPGQEAKSVPATTPPASKSLHRMLPHKGNKPKLAIIIDDVSHKYQIDAIKTLPYHITPSIFPPSELSSTSNQLTRYVKHYMVHLPMESGSAAMNRMKGMLFTRYSKEKVQARVDEIRRLFPHDVFINNHTGSVFTANYKAMKQLYGMLRKKGFVFIDSRTTNKSTVRKIAHAYHDTYIARDVFLDNVQKEAAILKQLRYAVKIAKKRGFSIAIGHPHKATLQALRHAGKILEGVQTVYVDELYRK